MVMHFAMTPAQSADLDQFLTAVQDRRSPQYHRFLTPEQYAARFGLQDSDIGKVVGWLEESGFGSIQVARSKTWVSFAGRAEQAERAFHVSLQRYSLKGEMYFANADDPQIPRAFDGVVQSIRGLHNFGLKPRSVRARPRFTAGDGSQFLAPGDWATVYDVNPLWNSGIDGTGVTIAVPGQSSVSMSDIAAFRAAAGLPANNPTVVVPPGSTTPGILKTSGDEGESDLDLEWSGAIARNADIVFVTATNVEDAIQYVIDQNLAPILTISYGSCEADLSSSDFQSSEKLFQQANAQGMTVVAAAGDNGAADCDDISKGPATHGLAVDYPAASQYVTGIGGTALSLSSQETYVTEGVWNNYGNGATGGGASKLETKPAWQTRPGVPTTDNARDVPDVAFTASPDQYGLLICTDGGCTNGFYDSKGDLWTSGGTSAGSPTFAGILALTIEKGGSGTRLGNINPNLYSLAQISTTVFHDVIQGNNEVPCTQATTDCPNGDSIGFQAGPGYDQTTGLGSVDAYNFAEQWFGDIQLSANPQTLTIQPGSSATATVTVTPQNKFTGAVTFSCSVSSSLIDVSCAVPGTVNTSGQVTLTVTAATTARTPLWKRFRFTPPRPRTLLIVGALLLLGIAVPLFARAPRVSKKAPVYGGVAALFSLALVIASCGGSGSDPVSGGGSTTSSALPLTLTCSLPNATAFQFYTGSCIGSGGTGTLGYFISSGSLPAGLKLDGSSGAIAGVPTQVGSSTFTVEVSDSASHPQTASYAASLAVNSSLTLSCTFPSTSTTGTAIQGSCLTSGGDAPLSFSIASGALPAGLSINNSGYITGTLTTPGTSSFVVQVSDSATPPETATQSINNFVVTAGTLHLYCPDQQDKTQMPYKGTCGVQGGTPPFTYTVLSGTTAPGISFDTSTATASGIPTKAGTYSFLVKISDSGSPVQTALSPFNLTVYQTQPLGASCPNGEIPLGSLYLGGCSIYGGNSPYNLKIVSGSLPPGITADSYGNFSGTPTAMGAYPYTVQIVDSSVPPMSIQVSQTLTVGPRAPESGTVTITATSGGIVNTTTINVTVP